MDRPTLVIVSGPPGSGKTTLAHAIARAIPCPVIARDEIKEGIVHTLGGGEPDWGGPVSKQTFDTFFAVVELMIERGVTIVAEAAFQHRLWEPGTRPLIDAADMRIVRCTVSPSVARRRIEQRVADPARASHNDAEFLAALDSGEISLEAFDELKLDVPTLRVDTTEGYDPSLDDILAFIR